MSEAQAHPFSRLTPDAVLDALAALGLDVDGRLSALSSYENRVYLAHRHDEPPVVAKFYRPQRWSEAQIREEHRFALQLAEQEVPMVAPMVLRGDTLHHWQVDHETTFCLAVAPRRGGRQPDCDDPEVLTWLGRFLARLHVVGEQQDFAVRPELNLQTMGWDSHRAIQDSGLVDPACWPAWDMAARRALDAVQLAMSGYRPRHIRLHGDCHLGNVLWTPMDMPQGGPHFVDLDDARMGPAVQDLWMLVSTDSRDRGWQWACLIEGYEQMRPFDRAELAWVEPLRTLRIIHYSAWLARRVDDPAFAQHFPWFATPAYWDEQTRVLLDQAAACLAPPLQVI
ncbi:MAG: serine/threonine protein kinase [Alphaproteobacteria bacterium]|nr:serine/threonine protein kinase [Alphaproteobacteria bacterium]